MSQDGFIGEVKLFAGNFAPRNWAFCDGTTLMIKDNTSLFSVIGTTYGGDGRTTFCLPDLRGRTPIGAGGGVGLSHYYWGQTVGVERVELSTSQIPSHSHATTVTTNAQSSVGSHTTPDGRVWSGSFESDKIYGDSPDTSMATNAVQVTVQSTGGSQNHENRPPSLAMYWIICIAGTYPDHH
ncbi:tail fiber protein [Chloroflexi bacterium TSY]|nr:tail fiber protein [Chloroflexi bacterium TSY]